MFTTLQRILRALLVVTCLSACSVTDGDDTSSSAGRGAPSDTNRIIVGHIDGAIGPVTAGYVQRVFSSAGPNTRAVIFTMDTPGGLDASMRDIIKSILGSPYPVIIYVHPSGARAASAGAIICLAAHAVAMAPGTNIGAAHPVSVGQGNMDSTMMDKVTNDAAAFARSLAAKRGRDVQWAEDVVRESISSTAEEVLELGVIDFIATDLSELLTLLEGHEVGMDDGSRILRTENANVTSIGATFRERFLARISDPNIAYLLMLAGIFGIFFELQNPGAIFPGVIGGISILLAFFALQLLPVNYAGLALILLAIVLFVLEIKIPSGGILTVGGIVSMLIGSIMFIDSPLPFMRVSITVIVPSVIFTALFFLFVVGVGLRAQRRRVATGSKGMRGEIGAARTTVGPDGGSVFVHGEHWNAYSDEDIPAGARVEIVEVDGLKLKVKPLGGSKQEV